MLDSLATKMVLVIGFLSLTILNIYIGKLKNKTRLHKYFKALVFMLQLHVLCLFLQLLCINSSFINPIYFEYLIGCEAEYIPIIFLITSLVFYNKEINTRKFWWLFIIPTISLLMLWTNDFHHMYFAKYSTNINEIEYGSYFIIHSIYSYIAFAVSMLIFIRSSIKASGFFSKQTALIVLGCLIPISVNVLGTMKIIDMTVYTTPILFIFTAICFSLAIVKYKALNITPVASRTIMDIMSDAYIVISNDGTILDTNKTFRNTFEKVIELKNDENLFEILQNNKLVDVNKLKKIIESSRKTKTLQTVEFHAKYKNFDKYFEVDVQPISSKLKSTDYVATLLLFKDITQHKLDIEEIEKKQEIIVKQSQLVSIGELAGGVAHDINTPISAIKTGIVMLNQSETITEEEKQILERMDNCATKIIKIVNSMRNQIRNLGGDTNVEFKISDVVNDVKVITFHEAKKNNSDVIISIKDDLKVKGDPTKLGQVITNLVVNGLQAYKENKGGKVEVTVIKANSKTALIKIKDYAGGIDESIAPYIFKNILTTKGTNGTGLGLYLAYSVIKGNFNGDIIFETKKGEGTTFYVTIPLKK